MMDAEQLALCINNPDYDGLFKSYLLFIARNNPNELHRVARDLCRLKRERRNPLYKNPRRRALVAAYNDAVGDTCHAPTFSAVKAAFIAKYGKKKWNKGHDDDQSHGDFSARKTLKILGYPLAKMKKGRPKGAKSVRTLKEGIAKKK